MIDTHIHLDQYRSTELTNLIDDWQRNGIEGVVAVATDLRSSYHILEISERFPQFVFPCIGWHPEQQLPAEHELLELLHLINIEKHQIACVGEIGLPYYRLQEERRLSLTPYLDLFTQFVKVARDNDLPVNLHTVYDHAELAFNILQQEQVTKAQFHWLKAKRTIVKKIVDAGYFISLTPEVCYRKRDEILVEETPLEQLLLETDGPWPFEGPFKHKQTTPIFLQKSVKKLAELTGETVQQVKQHVYRNTLTLYNRIKSVKGG